MKFRILLRSFDNELINRACDELRATLLQTDCTLNRITCSKTITSLPQEAINGI
jgi:ribosomal protein S10